jgi:hypothetical protein
MKTITIKNLELQFDSVDAGADQHTCLYMIDRINEELPLHFNGQQPQILIDAKDVVFSIAGEKTEDEIKEQVVLDTLALVLRNYGLRQYLNINDSGHSQVERDLAKQVIMNLKTPK